MTAGIPRDGLPRSPYQGAVSPHEPTEMDFTIAAYNHDRSKAPETGLCLCIEQPAHWKRLHAVSGRTERDVIQFLHLGAVILLSRHEFEDSAPHLVRADGTIDPILRKMPPLIVLDGVGRRDGPIMSKRTFIGTRLPGNIYVVSLLERFRT